MRKIKNLSLAEGSSKALNDWIIEKKGTYVKDELAKRAGVSRQFLYNHRLKIEAGEEKIEDVLSLKALNNVITYFNETQDKPVLDEKEETKILKEQLKRVNRLRKSQNKEPLKMAEFLGNADAEEEE